MSSCQTLAYELRDTATGTRLTVLLPGGATYIQDFPLPVDEIKRVTIQYPESGGLIITMIEQNSRGHVSFIPPTALQRYLRDAHSSPIHATRGEAHHSPTSCPQ